MRVKFGVLEQTKGLHLHAKFHLNVFTVSASGSQNLNFFWQILTFGGLLYRPLSPTWAKVGVLSQTHGVRLCAKFRNDRFILSPSGGEKPQFCPIWISAFSGVANWHQIGKS